MAFQSATGDREGQILIRQITTITAEAGATPGLPLQSRLEANVKVKGFGKVQDRPQSGPREHLHAKEQLTLLAALEAPAVQHKLFTSLLAAFRSSRNLVGDRTSAALLVLPTTGDACYVM